MKTKMEIEDYTRRERLIRESVELRKRFAVLIVGKDSVSVYKDLADEKHLAIWTIAQKIHLYGTYAGYKDAVLQYEKKIRERITLQT